MPRSPLSRGRILGDAEISLERAGFELGTPKAGIITFGFPGNRRLAPLHSSGSEQDRHGHREQSRRHVADAGRESEHARYEPAGPANQEGASSRLARIPDR
jgi:hypothetical protein